MDSFISNRTKSVKPSATLAMNALANQLIQEGKNVINLSIGEPDFDTPEFIKQAAILAIRSGFTKYTPVDGILPLKQAITNKLRRDNQLDYQSDQIIVSTGVKQGLYNLIQATLNPGDEAIVPAPYWVSYPAMIELAGAKPVIIRSRLVQQFKMTAEQLEVAITPKTRFLFLNSPNNPSGMLYSEKELKSLSEVLMNHPSILIASDDIYECIQWTTNQRFVNILNVCPALKERTVIFNGVSKSYAMTGWRIGYAAGSRTIISAMKKIQSQSTSSPNSIAQKAAFTAIQAGYSCTQTMISSFRKRHDFLYQAFKGMSGIECIPSVGTFYLLIDASKTIERLKLESDVELARYLLNNQNIATVPGSAFGIPNYLRFSYATSLEQLQEAVERLTPVFNV